MFGYLKMIVRVVYVGWRRIFNGLVIDKYCFGLFVFGIVLI